MPFICTAMPLHGSCRRASRPRGSSGRSSPKRGITIKDPFTAPFRTIPNAYETLMAYMKVNGLEHQEEKNVISCFEKEYERDGTTYMDVYIQIK